MRLLALSALTISLASAVGAASAQPAPTAATLADARCLLGMVALSNAEEQNAQQLGQLGVVFFTGRIAAREPNFDFARLKSIAATMNDTKAVDADLKQNCVPTVDKYMQQMSAALSPPKAATPPAAGTPPAAAPPKK
jgi:uncharacterized membrane protein YccC